VLIPIIAVGAAAAYTYTQPPVYRASMKMVVGQQQALFQPDVSGATEPFTQTMSDLVASDVVASQVIDRLGLDMQPASLLDNLRVSTKPMTAVIDISYDDTNPTRAVEVLEEVGNVFSALVQQRFAVPAGKDATPAVTATVFDPAHNERDLVRPRPLLNLGVAAVLGLALGVLLVFLMEQRRRATAARLAPLPSPDRRDALEAAFSRPAVSAPESGSRADWRGRE
jgi:capsular polysaccharide biosynthesis protein